MPISNERDTERSASAAAVGESAELRKLQQREASREEEVREASSLVKNIAFLAVSVFAAYLFTEAGVFDGLLAKVGALDLVGSFIGGMFFTSIFTAVPAAVVLAKIAQTEQLLLMVLFGGAGGVVGDFILFRFLKSHFTDEIVSVFVHPPRRRLGRIFHLKFFHWAPVIVGGLIIASPLPDELGLMLMGIVDLKPKTLMLISFIFNSLGILVLALVARAIG